MRRLALATLATIALAGIAQPAAARSFVLCNNAVRVDLYPPIVERTGPGGGTVTFNAYFYESRGRPVLLSWADTRQAGAYTVVRLHKELVLGANASRQLNPLVVLRLDNAQMAMPLDASRVVPHLAVTCQDP